MEIAVKNEHMIYDVSCPENFVFAKTYKSGITCIYWSICGSDTFDKIYDYLESNDKYSQVGMMGSFDSNNIYFETEGETIRLQSPEIMDYSIYISEPKEDLETNLMKICRICLEIQKNFID